MYTHMYVTCINQRKTNAIIEPTEKIIFQYYPIWQHSNDILFSILLLENN